MIEIGETRTAHHVRRWAAAAIACLLLIGLATGAAPRRAPAAPPRPTARFTNPLDVKVADPCVLKVGTTYYLYGTAARPRDADEGMPVWSSRDLVHWTSHGSAFVKRPGGWATHWFWGPDVIQTPHGYRMYYGAFRMVAGKHIGRICAADSVSPLGPFVDVKAPMFEWDGPDQLLDVFVLVDRNRRQYLYFTEGTSGRNTIWAAPLTPDGLSLTQKPVRILQPDQPWETEPINEGAFVIRKGSTYYLLFSINDFRNPQYGVGLATAPSPMGPWRKRTAGPIVRQAPGLRGPGCAGLIDSPDGKQVWAYYHVHLQPDGYVRQLALSRARFVDRGAGPAELRIDAPSTAPQVLPSGSPVVLPGASDSLSRPLDRRRWTVVDEEPGHWRTGTDGLEIDALDGDMWRGRGDYRNLFLQQAPAGDFSVEAQVRAAPPGDFGQAFLTIWQDADHFVRIGLVHAGGLKLSAALEIDGVYEETLADNPLGAAARLRIARRNSLYRFEAGDGRTWRRVGPDREAFFSLPRIGLGAISPGSMQPFTARFRDWRIRPVPGGSSR